MMIISSGNNRFDIDFTSNGLVGFHGTSDFAKNDIERQGFFPIKFFSLADHEKILGIADELNIYTFYYTNWLKMRSVTFTKHENDAVNHVLNGKIGGQGLERVSDILESIKSIGNDNQIKLSSQYLSIIDKIRQYHPIVYAVDLSNLGDRLEESTSSPLFHFKFDNPGIQNKNSEIGPSRLIARLDAIRT